MGENKWLIRDPRGHLVLALLVLLSAALVLILLSMLTGGDPWNAAQYLGFAGAVGLAVVNGHTLRQRRRSRWWLLLYLVGLGFVPLLIALLARPGREAGSLPA